MSENPRRCGHSIQLVSHKLIEPTQDTGSEIRCEIHALRNPCVRKIITRAFEIPATSPKKLNPAASGENDEDEPPELIPDDDEVIRVKTPASDEKDEDEPPKLISDDDDEVIRLHFSMRKCSGLDS